MRNIPIKSMAVLAAAALFAVQSMAQTYNTSYGSSAMPSTATGRFNAAFGFWALQNNSTGNWNTAVGASALANNNANNNTAVGMNALQYNTTGYANNGVGSGALYSNISGYGNNALGFNALNLNTTGNANSAFGHWALQQNSTGSNNTASGASALQQNSTGGNNTANGASALQQNSTGSRNTANGVWALVANTTGNNNTASGMGALGNNTTGTDNMAVGTNALLSNTTGGENTAIGTSALTSNTTGSNNIGMGYLANCVSTTASNQLNIGNAIFGTDLSGSIANPAGNIGIGTAAPRGRLEVIGTGVFSPSATSSSLVLDGSALDRTNNFSNVRMVATSANGGASLSTKIDNWGGYFNWVMGSQNGDVEMMRINGWNGFMGIGTANPLAMLHVTGSVLVGLPTATDVYHAGSYLFDVKGNMRAEKLTVNMTGADFVFGPSYRLKPLAEVGAFIKVNHRLPGIAPATKMQREGVEVGEQQTKLLQKIEELTLYAIAQDKKQETQNRLIAEQGRLLLLLQEEMAELKKANHP